MTTTPIAANGGTTAAASLPGLHLGAPAAFGPLTVFPVWTDAPIPRQREYVTTHRGTSRVTELDGEPQVGQVQVTNGSRRPLVMFGGSLLEAGWQHRVLLRDTAVAAGGTGILDVACVEAHRWGGSDHVQRSGDRRAPLSVRGATWGIRPEATDRFRPGTRRATDQSDVWRRVTHYERRFGASATSSLVEISQRYDNEVRRLTDRVRPLPAQRGALIGIGGHPVLLEVFDHPRTLTQEWTGILGSIWLDARDQEPIPTPGARARAFAHRVNRVRPVELGRSGSGIEHTLEDLELFTGRALTLGMTMVHASTLNLRHELVLAV